ncbi:MAG TPA: ATP-binding protein [Tepidisphaeraceae bacterium]|jgi:predicted ATPase|nr:ATP-binding protein [Tepidisphaeraceae bacterium]
MKRIVLTGGPGSGKTVLTSRLAAMHPERFVRVPEAATQVYDMLQTRWDRLDEAGRRDVQRQIYRLQVEQETTVAKMNPGRVLLLDRGTIDGATYWPDGPEGYWADLGTSLEQELARYDVVIWMQTSAVLGLYDGDASNSCRFEDAEAAVAAGNRLVVLWGNHRRLIRVEAYPTLDEKFAIVEQTLHALI